MPLLPPQAGYDTSNTHCLILHVFFTLQHPCLLAHSGALLHHPVCYHNEEADPGKVQGRVQDTPQTQECMTFHGWLVNCNQFFRVTVKNKHCIWSPLSVSWMVPLPSFPSTWYDTGISHSHMARDGTRERKNPVKLYRSSQFYYVGIILCNHSIH